MSLEMSNEVVLFVPTRQVRRNPADPDMEPIAHTLQRRLDCAHQHSVACEAWPDTRCDHGLDKYFGHQDRRHVPFFVLLSADSAPIFAKWPLDKREGCLQRSFKVEGRGVAFTGFWCRDHRLPVLLIAGIA